MLRGGCYIRALRRSNPRRSSKTQWTRKQPRQSMIIFIRLFGSGNCPPSRPTLFALCRFRSIRDIWFLMLEKATRLDDQSAPISRVSQSIAHSLFGFSNANFPRESPEEKIQECCLSCVFGAAPSKSARHKVCAYQ